MALHAYFMHTSLRHFVEFLENVMSFSKDMSGVTTETRARILVNGSILNSVVTLILIKKPRS